MLFGSVELASSLAVVVRQTLDIWDGEIITCIFTNDPKILSAAM